MLTAEAEYVSTIIVFACAISDVPRGRSRKVFAVKQDSTFILKERIVEYYDSIPRTTFYAKT